MRAQTRARPTSAWRAWSEVVESVERNSRASGIGRAFSQSRAGQERTGRKAGAGRRAQAGQGASREQKTERERERAAETKASRRCLVDYVAVEDGGGSRGERISKLQQGGCRSQSASLIGVGRRRRDQGTAAHGPTCPGVGAVATKIIISFPHLDSPAQYTNTLQTP